MALFFIVYCLTGCMTGGGKGSGYGEYGEKGLSGLGMRWCWDDYYRRELGLVVRFVGWI